MASTTIQGSEFTVGTEMPDGRTYAGVSPTGPLYVRDLNGNQKSSVPTVDHAQIEAEKQTAAGFQLHRPLKVEEVKFPTKPTNDKTPAKPGTGVPRPLFGG